MKARKLSHIRLFLFMVILLFSYIYVIEKRWKDHKPRERS